MRRGLTLIETVICISFISIFSLLLIIMIDISRNKNITQEEIYKINSEIHDFEKSFIRLIEQYDNNTWFFSSNSITTNEKVIFTKNENECCFYYIDGTTKKIKLSQTFKLVYVNQNLLKIETMVQNSKYSKHFYIGGVIYDN